MQEDKKLKDLLNRWAMEDVPADFTSKVMQRVEASLFAQQPAVSSGKNKLLKIWIVAFSLISVVLLSLSIAMNGITIPFHFTIQLSENSCKQIGYFILAFWIVILGNELSKRMRFTNVTV